MDEFFSRDVYRVDQIPDFESGEKRAVFRCDPIPSGWAMAIGEIAHNLRSSLDHAINEMTVIESGRPLDHTEFPVFDDEARFLGNTKRGQPTRGSGLFKIRGINEEAMAIVQQL